MKKMFFVPIFLLTTPALAHFGDHTAMSLMALAGHVFETDHIVFAAIAVVTGIVSYRAGRKAEAQKKAGTFIDKYGDKSAHYRRMIEILAQ